MRFSRKNEPVQYVHYSLRTAHGEITVCSDPDPVSVTNDRRFITCPDCRRITENWRKE